MNKCSLHMNDNPELFNKTNYLTRKDAVNSLNDFVRKFKCKRNPRVMDIGSADGSVTKILSHYLPKHYDVLLGCDINTNSVKYANDRYGTDRIKFIHLDIEAELPNNLKEDFDQVFSFCTLHWLADPEIGYRNVYNLLKDGGECFLTVMAKMPIYDIFCALSRTVKWAPWTNNIERFVPPYHDCQDPDDIIRDALMTIGFNYVETKCKQKVYVYKTIEVLKESMSSVNPFKIPEHLQEEFMEDFVDVTREMRLIAEDDSVKISYNIILIHCVKQDRGQ